MIPEFCHVSGGRTSAMMARLIQDRQPTYLFCNTGIEPPATYKFLQDLKTHFDMDIIWLEYRNYAPFFEIVGNNSADRTGIWFEKLMEKRQAVPNSFKRFCTGELKVKTARRYIRSLGIKEWVSYIGFRADEPDRERKTKTGKRVIEHFKYPLTEQNITARDVAAFWKKQYFDLDLPIMPNGKTIGGNCMGCFWHSEYQHIQLLKTNPEHYAWLERMEERFGHSFNDKYSYRQLREQYENNPQLSFSEEEFYCQSSRGTCGR